MNKKVSELTEAAQINDNDIFMILQNNENKRVSISKLLPIQRANVTLNSTIQANTNYTIPLNYKVGNNSLEVFYLGSKLEKRSRLQRNRRSGLYIKYNTIYRLCWRFRYEQCRRI